MQMLKSSNLVHFRRLNSDHLGVYGVCDDNSSAFDSRQTPLLQLRHVDSRACKCLSLRYKPQTEHKHNQSRYDNRYVLHIHFRNRHRSRETVNNVQEHNPDNSRGVDDWTKLAEGEEAFGKDRRSASIEHDGLWDDAGGLQEDDRGSDHGGEGCCGAEEDQAVELLSGMLDETCGLLRGPRSDNLPKCMCQRASSRSRACGKCD
jgi:hypothetical protein